MIPSPPDDAGLLLPRRPLPATPLLLSPDQLTKLAVGRQLHRHVVRAAALLIATIDAHPDATIPRHVLAAALADLRHLVFRTPDQTPPTT